MKKPKCRILSTIIKGSSNPERVGLRKPVFVTEDGFLSLKKLTVKTN